MTAVVVATPTGLAGLFDELKTEALNIWENIKNEAVHDVEVIAEKLGPLVKSEAAILLGQLKTIALNTVVSLAQAEFDSLTGAQKHTITANTIVQAAIASGKSVALQDAKTLAQGAFDALVYAAPTPAQ